MKRVALLSQHVAVNSVDAKGTTLTITDNRTGKNYSLPITDNTIKATDLKQIKDANGKILKTFDPGYMNTTCCISKISFIDGDKGILRYRGIPIEQLAEKSNFLEVAYLLLYGDLPSKSQWETWNSDIMENVHVHDDMVKLHEAFRYDAHPMGMIVSAFAAMGTLHPEANPAVAGQAVYEDKKLRNKQIATILGAGPTIAAMAYRKRIGRPFIAPNPDLGYTENFLYMLDIMHEGPKEYRPHPTLVKALDILFVLHAEHELNCSTSAMRHLASSNVDVYSATSAACAALYGPRHGGANEAVLRMLEKIGDVSKVPQFIEGVKNKKEKLMGFGHRVYKSYDPRAKVVRSLADEVFKLTGQDPLIDVAMALEKTALSDEYFIKKKLYPNVDFYSGLIYKAMGIPTDMFTILFTIPRLAGWLSHWQEWIDDPENRIYRPFQVYKGIDIRDYEDISARKASKVEPGPIVRSAINRRRDASLNKQRNGYGKIYPGTD
jgi:citrate synthase